MQLLDKYATGIKRSSFMIKIQGRKEKGLVGETEIDNHKYLSSMFQEELKCHIDEFKQKAAVVVHLDVQESYEKLVQSKKSYDTLAEAKPATRVNFNEDDPWAKKRAAASNRDAQNQYAAALMSAKKQYEDCLTQHIGLRDEFVKQVNLVISHYNSQLTYYYKASVKTKDAEIQYFPLAKVEEFDEMFKLKGEMTDVL